MTASKDNRLNTALEHPISYGIGVIFVLIGVAQGWIYGWFGVVLIGIAAFGSYRWFQKQRAQA